MMRWHTYMKSLMLLLRRALAMSATDGFLLSLRKMQSQESIEMMGR